MPCGCPPMTQGWGWRKTKDRVRLSAPLSRQQRRPQACEEPGRPLSHQPRSGYSTGPVCKSRGAGRPREFPKSRGQRDTRTFKALPQGPGLTVSKSWPVPYMNRGRVECQDPKEAQRADSATPPSDGGPAARRVTEPVPEGSCSLSFLTQTMRTIK